jgi:endogenous inhibitor of DNA gyrase (YacG/DUF329 family)
MSTVKSVPCPTCKRAIIWSEQYPWRPFCSERCRLVDLGAWLANAHAIPGEPVDETVREPGAEEPDPPGR